MLATGNAGKVRELTDLLGGRFSIEPRPRDLPETIEDGRTLLDNATKKAVEVFAHTGAMALADDTGLFVSALDGRPGVRSARFAGPNSNDALNRAKLVDEMADVEAERRGAYFETVVAIVGADFTERSGDGENPRNTGPAAAVPLVPLVGRGRVHGRIATEPRGEGGFGYDALFIPDEGDGRTFAQMTLAEKQVISHRSRALAQAQQLLEGSAATGES